MRMPDVAGLGAFTESGQVLQVEYEGESADYLHAMYVDSVASIASGREISAFPKKAGTPSLYVDSDTLVGTLDYGTLRVATATMGYKHAPMSDEDAIAEIGRPTFGLKVLPGYDRRSEEHTSELQSRQYLVCRLLLEKKKNNNNTAPLILHSASSR